MRSIKCRIKILSINTINLCAVFATVRAGAESARNLTVTEVHNGLIAESNNSFNQFFAIEAIGIYLTNLHILFVFIDEQTDPDHPTMAAYGVTDSTPSRNIIGFRLRGSHWEYVTGPNNFNSIQMSRSPQIQQALYSRSEQLNAWQ